MKVLIISDSHNNISNLKHVLGFAKRVNISAVIHCGDWDKIEAAQTIVDFKIPLYSILGNADIDSDIEEFLKFNSKKFDPHFLKFELDGRKIGVIHNIKDLNSKYEGFDIIFSGHFHSKEEKMVDFVKLVRPGALANGINFAIYETTNNTVEFFNND